MAQKLTDSQVKANNRKLAIEKLKEGLTLVFGAENIYQVGYDEFSVFIGNSPNGEPMYINYSPTAKSYKDRLTATKFCKAYNGEEEAKKFREILEKKTAENEEKARLKAEKIERDKIAREKQRIERERIRKEKEEKRGK